MSSRKDELSWRREGRYTSWPPEVHLASLAANQWGPMITKPDDYSGLDHSDSFTKLH